jgi:hypothetical protein
MTGEPLIAESERLAYLFDGEVSIWAHPEGLALYAAGDGSDEYGGLGGGSSGVSWPDVLTHAPTAALADALAGRDGVVTFTEDSADNTLHGSEIWYQVATWLDAKMGFDQFAQRLTRLVIVPTIEGEP